MLVDASCLERNLYLTLQLIELGKPVVLALNMMDIVEERGMEIDLHRLPEDARYSCHSGIGKKTSGLEILMHAVAHHKEYASQGFHPSSFRQGRDTSMTTIVNMPWFIMMRLRTRLMRSSNSSARNTLIWKLCAGMRSRTLEQDETVTEHFPVDMSGIADRSYEKRYY